ncbi:hypothetical protein C2G38_2217233 [Gigaspora rosea]|uniref:Uncharacterized protein n=1 Tax=Gigaspora rosea TaxID=44941 RepID=A0A397UGG1_9GLOM|nr:hypothetical protein C2G38_2217233 [Gigaspora rosea]
MEDPKKKPIPNLLRTRPESRIDFFATIVASMDITPPNQNSDPNSTESLDISSKEQDLYSGESYYEYDSDDEESEETEEETDSKFYGQEAFHQRSFGRTRLQSFGWRTNEASPTMKLNCFETVV